jgi:ribosomally synthesized peptide (two-chain TOMM family)
MSTSNLVDFRTTYLRAIAQAWVDPAFLNELATPGGGAKALDDFFGYRWPWADLTLTFRKHGAEWNPAETGGWFGTLRDAIVVHAPLSPARVKGLGPADHTRAIAAYYQQRPTFLGPNGKGGAGDANAASGTPGHGGPLNLQAYDPGLGSWDSFLHLGAATFRAMALAWHNETFRHELCDNSVRALEGWLGYNSPWNFKIQFVDASDECVWNHAKNQWALVPNELVLWLPRPPADEGIRPIALTAYNNTGEAYPFTCCT